MLRSCNTIIRSLSNSTAKKSGPIQELIEQKIRKHFSPYNLFHCEVQNVSWKHNVPKGSETHFEVYIVTDKFEQQKRIDRHKLVNELLADEIKKVHSVSLKLLEPTRWYSSMQRGLKLQEIYQTPPCAGGKLRELAQQSANAAKTEKVESKSDKQQE